MWNTDFKLAQRNQLVLAKIRPITFIDGGYQLGFIHLDTNLFSPQDSANAIDLERVERWVSMDAVERLFSQLEELVNIPPDQPSVRPMREGIEEYEIGGES